MGKSSAKPARREQARRARAEALRKARARRRRTRIGAWVAGIAVVGVLGWTIVAANAGGSSGAAVRADDPVLGDPSAPVTIVQYGDYKCPFCTRFFVQTQPQLQRRYIDTGKVRLVWRDFPNIDAESEPAAVAAWCAGQQGRFWQYHDALYTFVWNTFYGQGINVEGRMAYAAHYLDLARRVGGLDLDAFRSCLGSSRALDAVRRGRALGTSQGVQGTPTFFIDGQKVVGAQPFEVFARLIDQELASR